MTATKQVSILSVRLPQSELRRIKSLAASRGITLQEAVHQALQAWAFKSRLETLPPLDALEGSLAAVDVARIMREDRHAELAKDRARLK
jgi:hypothetical protein